VIYGLNVAAIIKEVHESATADATVRQALINGSENS
jgi:hypothetical protein